MSISLILSNYNHKHYLNACLASVYSQSRLPDEVIVVDDCSTDGSFELLKNLANKYRFALYQTHKNSGPSTARNLGIAKAKSDLLAFLDSDDEFLQGKLKKQDEAFTKHPEAALCYTDSKIIDEAGKELPFQYSQFALPKNGRILTHLMRANCIHLSSVMVKKDYMAKVLFDDSLRQAEDYRAWVKIAHLNDNFVYIDEALTIYRRGGKSLSSQRLSTIANTIRVIHGFQPLAVDAEAKNNLAEQEFALLMEQSDIQFRSGDSSAIESLKKARGFRKLPKLLTLAIALSKLHFSGANFLYKIHQRRVARQNFDEKQKFRVMAGDEL